MYTFVLMARLFNYHFIVTRTITTSTPALELSCSIGKFRIISAHTTRRDTRNKFQLVTSTLRVTPYKLSKYATPHELLIQLLRNVFIFSELQTRRDIPFIPSVLEISRHHGHFISSVLITMWHMVISVDETSPPDENAAIQDLTALVSSKNTRGGDLPSGDSRVG